MENAAEGEGQEGQQSSSFREGSEIVQIIDNGLLQ